MPQWIWRGSKWKLWRYLWIWAFIFPSISAAYAWSHRCSLLIISDFCENSLCLIVAILSWSFMIERSWVSIGWCWSFLGFLSFLFLYFFPGIVVFLLSSIVPSSMIDLFLVTKMFCIDECLVLILSLGAVSERCCLFDLEEVDHFQLGSFCLACFLFVEVLNKIQWCTKILSLCLIKI